MGDAPWRCVAHCPKQKNFSPNEGREVSRGATFVRIALPFHEIAGKNSVKSYRNKNCVCDDTNATPVSLLQIQRQRLDILSHDNGGDLRQNVLGSRLSVCDSSVHSTSLELPTSHQFSQLSEIRPTSTRPNQRLYCRLYTTDF